MKVIPWLTKLSFLSHFLLWYDLLLLPQHSLHGSHTGLLALPSSPPLGHWACSFPHPFPWIWSWLTPFTIPVLATCHLLSESPFGHPNLNATPTPISALSIPSLTLLFSHSSHHHLTCWIFHWSNLQEGWDFCCSPLHYPQCLEQAHARCPVNNG